MTPTRQWQYLVGISTLMLVSVLAYCAPPGMLGKPSLDITGIVFDQDTKQPIEGAYVLAIYEASGGSWAGTNNWCIKTKGMTTAKDGRYHFPVEKLDNKSPAKIAAIKADYYLFSSLAPSEALQQAQSKETYTNRDVYLKRQAVGKQEFQYGPPERYCTRAKSIEDAAAAAAFFRLELNEYIKYKLSDEAIKNIRKINDDFEKLPHSK